MDVVLRGNPQETTTMKCRIEKATMTEEEANAKFRDMMAKELKGRGYKDIEIVKGSMFFKAGCAKVTKSDGKRIWVRMIVPQNHTVYRIAHFRVTEEEEVAE